MSAESHFIEFSRPFIEATKNVFKTMAFTSLETQKPIIKSDSISRGDVSAVLGLSGEMEKNGTRCQYKAMLVISFPYETYFQI
ncbi:MAG: hypothetical protein H7281_18640, partial [Bacteriovorax sp.]|nr:hypothetical protein [Bacteriovorax sp.]